VSSTAEEPSDLADEIAGEAASFVAAVESVAGGLKPGSTMSVLLLALSDILSAGAKLGAREDIAATSVPADAPLADAAQLGSQQNTSALRTALAEQFGAVNEYRELIDPYLGDEAATAKLSDDLASICGDLLQGLALYTDGDYADSLAWWQYSYLSNWGPSASACLRAVQSLIALIRLGAPMGAPTEDLLGLDLRPQG